MRSNYNLTTKQAAILEFVQNNISNNGRPPTIREIGAKFAFKSTGTTRDHLKSLSQKGYIKLTARQSRAIKLTKYSCLKIPILGQITAGAPNLAHEEILDYVNLQELLPSQDKRIFALKIKGDSMIEKGIYEGDIAIIRKQQDANDGEIIAALLDQEATIKILKKTTRGYILVPANNRYREIKESFTILGKVTAIIKKF